ncbi:MAG TPA: chromate transporter [Candidatus Binataceae bacterium]|nr:chromate transporter [Candidatus Binataceae bacterium]
MHKLVTLGWVFALLSILAVGGGTAVLPEMQHMTVHQFHWITDKQFRDIYSLGQVAPGPNMLMVLVIGYRLAGAIGAAVVGLAFFLPDCILTFFVNRLWDRLSQSRWRLAMQRGLAPISIGLMLSGTYAIARLSIVNVAALTIAIATFGILAWRRINPVLLISAGALAYIAFKHW